METVTAVRFRRTYLILLALISLASATFGKTVYVSPTGAGDMSGSDPDNACLIKDVSGKISAGDTIQLADGAYEEWMTHSPATFDFSKKDIVMQGNVEHPENVTFDYRGDKFQNKRGYVVRYPGSVRGITFRNYRQQDASYPSMFLTVNLSGTFTIEYCRFENCSNDFGSNEQDCGCVLKMNHEATSSTTENVIMDHCVISCCSNRIYGVVSKWKNGGSLIVRDCVFENCYSRQGGGSAIYFNDTKGDDLVERCVFRGCTSDATSMRPAAIYVNNGTADHGVDIRSCLFDGNTIVKQGDGVCVFSETVGKCNVDNCTFVNNGSETVTDTVPLHGKTTVKMKATNCVFWNNADKDGKVNKYSTNVTMENCASTLSDSPFVDAENGDYMLAKKVGGEANPCVGTGSKLDWMSAESLDLAGNPRLRDGDVVDLGCYALYRASKLGFMMFLR